MQIRRAIIVFILLTLVPLCALGGDGDQINPAGRFRGKKTGAYTLKVVGGYRGKGTSSVGSTSVSIAVELKAPNGCVCSTSFDNMNLTNDRFQGTASFNNTTLTLSGRLDMPAATDSHQSVSQAITGRVTATFFDTEGNGGRLVAIQDSASREIVPASP
jgi:hypothetical protein